MLLFGHPSFDAVLSNRSRSQWPCGLRRGSWPFGYWDHGFESRLRHGHLSASFCVVLPCALRRADHSSKESYHMSK
jgi:hypothetical protein